MMSYLKKQAKSLKSINLSNLMINMREDHFVKVRTMIKDMIAKLENDASEEADRKAWCDEEMTNAMEHDDDDGDDDGTTRRSMMMMVMMRGKEGGGAIAIVYQ